MAGWYHITLSYNRCTDIREVIKTCDGWLVSYYIHTDGQANEKHTNDFIKNQMTGQYYILHCRTDDQSYEKHTIL